MKLREGGYYRRRDGEIVGPLIEDMPAATSLYPFGVFHGDDQEFYFTESGEYNATGGTHKFDLIEEVPAPSTEKPAKRALQVGDRVRCYGQQVYCSAGILPMQGRDGVVTAFVDAGWLQVSHDGILHEYHPKQCRRLVKRERRRVWVDPIRTVCEGDPFSFSPVEGWVEFVEVRRK